MVKKRKHTRKRHRRNPGPTGPERKHTTVKSHRRKVNPFKARHHRRKRNPETGIASLDPTKGSNIMQYALGAVVSSFATPTISTLFGLTGYAKYGIQLALGYAFYEVGKAIGMPKAGLAAALVTLGFTVKDFATDSGLIAGMHSLLGMIPARPQMNGSHSFLLGLRNFNRNLNGGYVPPISGYVPASAASGFSN